MTKLGFYELVLYQVSMLMSAFRVTITTTLNLKELTVTLVNHQAPGLNRYLTCKNPLDKNHQEAFIAELNDLQTYLYLDRENSIRHGLKVALIHMKPDAIEALKDMPPEQLQRMIDEELQRRKQ